MMFDWNNKAGMPAWAELGSADITESSNFYSQLFDWESDVSEHPDTAGYTTMRQGGLEVAGIGPLFRSGQPTAWTSYVIVEDADKTVQMARECGGSVYMEPGDIIEEGRGAIIIDPAGASVGVWQPRRFSGTPLTKVPGALCWTQLNTRDANAVRDFYSSLFNWEIEDCTDGDNAYWNWRIDGELIAPMMQMGSEVPSRIGSHWLVYFGVASTDDTITRATELGGNVVMSAVDFEPGRVAVLSDPDGANFAVVALH